MNSKNSWIYVDSFDKKWRFFITDSSDLAYSIDDKDGISSDNKIIDKDVLSFTIHVNGNQLHIIYFNKDRELKYCKYKEGAFYGTTIYQFEGKQLLIQELKALVCEDLLHILYIKSSEDCNDRGVLSHCIWDGDKVDIQELKPINLVSNIEDHYAVERLKGKELYLYFLTVENELVKVITGRYNGYRWGRFVRLYTITGDVLFFDAKSLYGVINILNVTKEDGKYSVDVVEVSNRAELLSSTKLFESKSFKDSTVFMKAENKLYACWKGKKGIYVSERDEIFWYNPTEYKIKEKSEIHTYNFAISSENPNYLEGNKILVLEGSESFKLFYPPMIQVTEDQQFSTEDNLVELLSQLEKSKESIEKLEKKMELTEFQLQQLKEESKKHINEGDKELIEQESIDDTKELVVPKYKNVPLITKRVISSHQGEGYIPEVRIDVPRHIRIGAKVEKVLLKRPRIRRSTIKIMEVPDKKEYYKVSFRYKLPYIFELESKKGNLYRFMGEIEDRHEATVYIPIEAEKQGYRFELDISLIEAINPVLISKGFKFYVNLLITTKVIVEEEIIVPHYSKDYPKNLVNPDKS
ncbi:MAG: hypothetical protein GX895_02220 [Clostridiales bacterium]|uniref:hypothetical protein n=1 Tax=Clostridium sp. N3C TaxID=1776758 RepID=UPI00092E1A68|nr:hypothetical protein [Clostridium sp. N3C]NLZ47599.1 hypothetical protein [Clostridiales bacterium]SCN23563.1 hypothetical protein N3C_1364 [Clostridium sp. N3C]